MQKTIIILISGILAVSCSLSRSSLSSIHNRTFNGTIAESILNQNLTNNSFNIQKAEIEFINNGEKEKFIASVKFEKPDKYLISLRSRAGIEGARILITRDSVLINDRIERKLYIGASGYLPGRFGISQNFIPLIFGDLLIGELCKNEINKCTGTECEVDCDYEGVTLNYLIDQEIRKVKSMNQVIRSVFKGAELKYSNYFEENNIVIPRNIEFNDIQHNTSVKIKIIKLEYPWNGTIEFVPGKGYEQVKLV